MLEVLQSIWLWLVVGIVLSALIEVAVPTSWFETHFGNGWSGLLLANLSVLAIAVPLYVCATSSVPIAATLVANGFPLGSALVFLIAGPATNVATILAVAKNLGRRTTVIYLGTIIVGSVLLSLGFSWVIRGVPSIRHIHPLDTPWWRLVTVAIFGCLMVYCAWIDIKRWFSGPSTCDHVEGADSHVRDAQPRITIGVDGMSCQNCADRLQKSLRKADGINSAIVDIRTHTAEISGPIKFDAVAEIVRECGFQVRNE
jgi:copper chaperone CopZ